MTEPTSGDATPWIIAENVHAAEVYADRAAFFVQKGPNVMITFTSRRIDNTAREPVLADVVIGRLTMPADGAHALAAGLFAWMQDRGLIPPKDAASN